jgi:hypothetical protein
MKKLVLLALVVAAVVSSAQAEVIGPSLINRPGVDTAPGYMFMYDSGAATPAFTMPGVVTQWSFYNDNGATQGGRTLEPIILKKSGTNWVVTGVGAAVTTPASLSGTMTFPFTLVAGSGLVGPGYTFAHHDTINAGTIEYTDTVGTGTHRYYGIGAATPALGTAYADAGFSARNRTYSEQMTTWDSLETLGNDLIDRPVAGDGAVGGLFMLSGGFTSSPGRLVEWAFFDNEDNTPDRLITPLLLQKTGANYFIRGIGTTRTTTEAGEQHYPFGLVAGSDYAGLDYFFAWRDGSTTVGNAGVIDWTDGVAPGIRYFGTGNITLDQNLAGGSAYNRAYSVQAYSLIPEPATLSLVGLGALALLRRRRA